LLWRACSSCCQGDLSAEALLAWVGPLLTGWTDSRGVEQRVHSEPSDLGSNWDASLVACGDAGLVGR